MIVTTRNGKIVDTSALQRKRESFIVVDEDGTPLCGRFAPKSKPNMYVAKMQQAKQGDYDVE
jgi:hypothetical protein